MIDLIGGSLEEAERATDVELLRRKLDKDSAANHSYASLLASTTNGQQVIIEAFADIDPDGRMIRSHLVSTNPPEATIKRMVETGMVFPKP